MKEIYVVLDSLPIQKPSMMLFDTGMHLLLLVVILTVTQFADARSISFCQCVTEELCSEINKQQFGREEIVTRINNEPSGVNCAQGYIYCCEKTENEDSESLESETPENYGVRNPILQEDSLKQELKNDEAYLGEFPWTAVLFGVKVNVHLGGGVLIGRSQVLTTAHTVVKHIRDKGIKVRLGEWDASSYSEKYPYREYSVSRVDIHPNFNISILANDIAIITLDQSVSFTKLTHITPARLPENFSNQQNHRCWVAMWEKDAFETCNALRSIQKKVELSVLNDQECEEKLQASKIGKNFILNKDSFICAGGEKGKGACTGDGGLPMVCDVSGRFEVVGLVSWGIGCAEDGIPGVYVDVAHYIPWIKKFL